MNTPEQSVFQNDKLIPLRRARELVGISRSKLYELLSAGTFPTPARLGSRCYFSELEVQKWIADRLAERSSREVTN